MAKSPDAFRTISEVADWLDRPAHVLRFWESKFSQVKPVKRAGGRRYYRPQDMLLLGGIKKLLHDDGMTIKGVQKTLREQGVHHVAELSQPLDGGTDTIVEAVADPAETLPDATLLDAPTVADTVTAIPQPIADSQPIPEPASAPVAAEMLPNPQQATLFDVEPEPEAEPVEASITPQQVGLQTTPSVPAPLAALLARRDRWTGVEAEKARALLLRARSHVAAMKGASKQG
ncbi:hypothetical protein TG4357_02506 [Thalassovita gelatinovora]|uniref:HTH merR-type domain-containing protein n=1 Tax=Thalassovita gelatinovora TaxID=53501 RepID=A0A0P1G1M9_THAGE|nr:MerR family transcriptional regulator [Thalassovita gelatinovora]CUH66597.1 hypothetical protein TG4357_02506 [Thalassovita gelatinovora]SEQ38635.1 MerR HTH family regulatory protein [Thalassovita gelatinovora]